MPVGPEKDRLRADMLSYCARDTSGMVDVYRKLQGINVSSDVPTST